MPLKEKLEIIESGKTHLFQKLVQKRVLEEFRGFRPEPTDYDVYNPLLIAKNRLVATGAIDLLLELLDYLPDPTCHIEPNPRILTGENFVVPKEIRISTRWQKHVDVKFLSYRELAIISFLDSTVITLSSRYSVMPVGNVSKSLEFSILGSNKTFFEQTLQPEQWQDREMMEAAMADALWANGLVLPAYVRGSMPLAQEAGFDDSFEVDSDTNNN